MSETKEPAAQTVYEVHDLDANDQLRAAVGMLKRIERLCRGPEGDELPEGIAYPPMIAGGAARDLLLGRKVKDFDIFWPIHKPYLIDAVADVAGDLAASWNGFKRNKAWQRDYELNGYCRDELLGVLSPTKYPAEIDIVFFDAAYGATPEAVVSTFDTSICRCWLELSDYNTIATVKGVSDFWKSIDQRTIWTYPKIQTRPEHLFRLNQKFPDFSLWIVDKGLREAYRDYWGHILSERNPAVA